jgi:hypothetical protein
MVIGWRLFTSSAVGAILSEFVRNIFVMRHILADSIVVCEIRVNGAARLV